MRNYCNSAELLSVIHSRYDSIRGIVILKDGETIYEEAFRGYDLDKPVHVASVTKSILSALVGIAVDQGAIRSVGQRVLEFFPEYQARGRCENRENATLEDLLNMTVPYAFDNWKEPLEDLCRSEDWVTFALNLMSDREAPGRFQYSTAGAHLLSAVITKATGKSAREFANEVLFEPIGMRTIADHPITVFDYENLFGSGLKGWAHDPRGISTGGWGLMLTPRDMARFGLLYLNRGAWDGRQVISGVRIEETFAPNDNHYGRLWWQMKENEEMIYAAMGDGGSMICCLPRKSLVVAVVSEFTANPEDPGLLIRDLSRL